MGLIDIWRNKHLDSNLYTWSNKDRPQQSRIDFWLISLDVVDKVLDSEIEPYILIDHKAITIKTDVKLTNHNKSKDYWKFNKTLLRNQDFQNKALELINKYWIQANSLKNYGKYCELMKYKIRRLAVRISKIVTHKEHGKDMYCINSRIMV